MLSQNTALPLSYKRQRVNEELNFEPLAYKTTALPLSYSPPTARAHYILNARRPELDSNQQPRD